MAVSSFADLEALGKDESSFSRFGIVLQQAIEAWGTEFEDQLKYSLELEGYGDSALKRDIRFTVTQVNNGVRFQLFFPEYGNYLDEGVRGAGGARKTTSKFQSTNNKGKMWKQKAPKSRFKFTNKRPPLYDSSGGGIETWANRRGLSKFAVQESVFRQGIEPTYWFSKVVDENYTESLVEALEEIGAKQLEIDFANALKKGMVK
jgi:hypothetical protein